MNIQLLSQYLGALALLVSMANTAWVWLSQSSRALATELDELDAEVTDHGKRIQNLESEVRHLPTQEDFTKLELALAEIKGSQRVTEREVQGIGRALNRIEDHLRTEKV